MPERCDASTACKAVPFIAVCRSSCLQTVLFIAVGVFCPCLGPVEFDLTDTNGEPTDGKISKVYT